MTGLGKAWCYLFGLRWEEADNYFEESAGKDGAEEGKEGEEE